MLRYKFVDNTSRTSLVVGRVMTYNFTSLVNTSAQTTRWFSAREARGNGPRKSEHIIPPLPFGIMLFITILVRWLRYLAVRQS